METEAYFQEKVYLSPDDMQKEIDSIDTLLVEKLKERLEEKCSSHGYVLPGTIELLTRSAGMVEFGKFTGEWAFIVKAKGKVFYPTEGNVLNVEVLKVNKMGVYAIFENAIRIMIPRDLHLGNEEFDKLQVGENIQVELKKSRFQLHDTFIVSVGVYKGKQIGTVKKLTPIVEETKEEEKEEEKEESKEEEEESKEEEEESKEERKEGAE
jgi:DNA-directed RNA polymerase subunit E'/Rpb7